MSSWPPPTLKEKRLHSNNYRPCSSSEDSEEEVVLVEDDRLVTVTVLLSSFPFDKVLKVKVCKLIISRINKKVPMNAILCSPQGNVYRTRHANINSSVVSRLSRVSDLSSLTSSISIISRSKSGGKKADVKNRSKVQRIMDELVNCVSPSQQLITLEEVLRNPDLR